jgi:hypothetical protein
MSFTVLKLDPMHDCQQLDPAYEQLSLADNVRSLRYEALMHCADNKLPTPVKGLTAQDYLLSLPKDDVWLLSQRRMQLIKQRHDEHMQQAATKNAEEAMKESFIKGLLGP